MGRFEAWNVNPRWQYIQLTLVVCIVALVAAAMFRQRAPLGGRPVPTSVEPLRTPNFDGALNKEERIYRGVDLDDLTQEASDQPGFAQASHLIFERVPESTLQQGEVLAKAHCTGCHGAHLDEGEGAQRVLEGEQHRHAGLRYIMGYKYGWRGPAVYRSIKYGTKNELMPAFEGVLTESEIQAVAHYIRSIQLNNPVTLKNR